MQVIPLHLCLKILKKETSVVNACEFVFKDEPRGIFAGVGQSIEEVLGVHDG